MLCLDRNARFFFVGLAISAAGCSGGDGPTEPGGSGAEIVMTLAFAEESLVLDRWADTATAVVKVQDQNGSTVTGVSLQWESLNPEVATVTGGLVRSVALGTGRVRVTASRTGATSATAELPIQVVVQPNAACKVPSKVARGGASGSIQFGQAQMLSHLPVPTHDGSRALAADFDGDDDADIVRLEYSYPTSNPYTGTVRVFRNDGGTLTDATASIVEGTIVPDHPRDFEIHDFTGDGAPDIFVAQHGFDAAPFPGAPNLFLTRNGTALANTFAATFTPASTRAFSHGAAAGDVDCDGDIDIMEVTVSTAAPNQLFLNNGSGKFTAAASRAISPSGGSAGNPWQETTFIDFDADGDPDLFLGARSGAGGNQDVLLVNDGFGRFSARTTVKTPAPRYTPDHAINNAKSADFNGDGLEDLLLFEITKPFSPVSVIRLLLNAGDGTFNDASTQWGIPAECSSEMVEPLYARDLNRDGWPDVLLPGHCPELGRAGVLVNTGSGFVSTPYSSVVPWLEWDSATPIDLNGDGQLELFFGERGGDVVLVPIG